MTTNTTPSPVIIGTSGNDILQGTSKTDITIAGKGDDTVYSSAGSDLVLLGKGNDTIIQNLSQTLQETTTRIGGLRNADVYYGGQGNDTIVIDLAGVQSAGAYKAAFSYAFQQYLNLNNNSLYDLGCGVKEYFSKNNVNLSANFHIAISQFENIKFINENSAPTDIVLSNKIIAENTAVGTVIGNLTSIDPNAGDTFSYGLVNDAGGKFAITGNSLVVNGNLDYEAQNSYTISIKSTDAGGLSVTKDFVINVTNVSDVAPTINPATFSIAENTPNGSNVGQVVASDQENDVIGYSIVSGNDTGVFSIDNSGIITVVDSSKLDYEGGVTQYKLIVQAADAGGNIGTGDVIINLANVQDAPPVVHSTVFYVSENSESIGQVIVDNPDNMTLQYALMLDGSSTSLFQIDNNGNITANQGVLNYESGVTQYNLTVAATNAAGTSAANIVINVANVAEDGFVSTYEDTPLIISPDSAQLTVTGITQPSHGTVVVDLDGNFFYTPNINYHGQDAFSYTVLDSKGGSTTANINVDVTSVSDPLAINPLGTINAVVASSPVVITGDGDYGSTITVKIGDNIVSENVVVGSDGRWSLPLDSYQWEDGNYTITAINNDTQESAESSFIVDITAPISPSFDVFSATNNLLPTISGTGETGSIITVQVGGEELTTTVTDGIWSVTPTSNLSEGDYTANVAAKDDAGNVSAISTMSFVVDTTAPSSPVVNVIGTINTAPVIAGIGEAGATIAIQVGGHNFTTVVSGSGEWSITPNIQFNDGIYEVTAMSTDPAGNTSEAVNTSFVVDKTPPSAPNIVGVSSSVVSSGVVCSTNDSTPTISGIGELGSTINLTLSDGSVFSTVITSTSVESTISDVDLAQDAAAFARNQILQQAATAMLAQANQTPGGALGLLRSVRYDGESLATSSVTGPSDQDGVNLAPAVTEYAIPSAAPSAPTWCMVNTNK